ncbi:hypothetical protein BACERE00193_00363 [Bacillus paranthracis]|uniref:Uncharacterized protein n=1 Tax=Bacillus paranthracis TaxID=2026186 RepID=A0A7D8H8A3_9BACI|nr:hypothetical protein BACERE00174_00279 [Bacillus paranthracis]SMD63483.1 hypothetical protein BACERE00184_00387 [Bacillus cereus]SMD65071.1 hypothetical protein BACERE00193_00363 [Bacillus paranthracis]SMD77151.1 hypothetical protein BACERE00176_00469 [Bacillus paranthracis]SME05350.1 hypothetical protein BACERE00175_03120 [Bacillus cereus]
MCSSRVACCKTVKGRSTGDWCILKCNISSVRNRIWIWQRNDSRLESYCTRSTIIDCSKRYTSGRICICLWYVIYHYSARYKGSPIRENVCQNNVIGGKKSGIRDSNCISENVSNCSYTFIHAFRCLYIR